MKNEKVYGNAAKFAYTHNSKLLKPFSEPEVYGTNESENERKYELVQDPITLENYDPTKTWVEIVWANASWGTVFEIQKTDGTWEEFYSHEGIVNQFNNPVYKMLSGNYKTTSDGLPIIRFKHTENVHNTISPPKNTDTNSHFFYKMMGRDISKKFVAYRINDLYWYNDIYLEDLQNATEEEIQRSLDSAFTKDSADCEFGIKLPTN
jgi:hypothetical protein